MQLLEYNSYYHYLLSTKKNQLNLNKMRNKNTDQQLLKKKKKIWQKSGEYQLTSKLIEIPTINDVISTYNSMINKKAILCSNPIVRINTKVR